ncbi:hypothetical protein ACLBYN_42990, partial [Pseudomonas aeruginosa]
MRSRTRPHTAARRQDAPHWNKEYPMNAAIHPRPAAERAPSYYAATLN